MNAMTALNIQQVGAFYRLRFHVSCKAASCPVTLLFRQVPADYELERWPMVGAFGQWLTARLQDYPQPSGLLGLVLLGRARRFLAASAEFSGWELEAMAFEPYAARQQMKHAELACAL